MKCSDIEHLLNRYIDKELPARKTAVLEGHLAGCQKCTQKLNESIKLKGLVQALPAYTVNPFLWTRIRTAIGMKPAAVPAWIIIPKILKLWTAIACSLILISSIVLTKVTKTEQFMYKEELSVQKAILEIPAVPENMEKITLNLLVYNGTKTEVPYGLF